MIPIMLCFMLLPLAIFGQMDKPKDKTMRIVEIAYEGEALQDKVSPLDKVSQLLEDRTELQYIDLANWEAFPYRPEVRFRIAHSNGQIWLKFYVTENHVLAQRTETNSATHHDSCVEFFLDMGQEGKYYNFEFNAIGTTHLAYGSDRGRRKWVDAALIRERIQIESSLGKHPIDIREDGRSWEMTVIIPSELFVNDVVTSLSGMEAKANFYKCGDDTEEPHYLSWNPVVSQRPDFHRPEFFGKLIFE